MQAGLLNKQIQILQPVNIKDEFGSDNTEYVLKYTTRAHVVNQSGTHTNENGDVYTSYSFEFTIRNQVVIDEYMIIVYKNKKYRILSIDDTYEDKLTINTEVINE